MQNVSQKTDDETSLELGNNVQQQQQQHGGGAGIVSSTPQSTNNSTPTKSETETYSENPKFMSETSESEEDSVSEVDSFMVETEFEEDHQTEATKFLLSPDEYRNVDPETQARLEALLQAAGLGQLAEKDGKALGDPEVLRRLTSSVSCALDEAAAALTRMRSDNAANAAQGTSSSSAARPSSQATTAPPGQAEKISLVEACTDGDVGTVKKLLTEGRSVHETSEEGESLLSLACSAGYFELAQVLLAMHANVEDRGIKGECTPLMEAASAGHLDIVKLLAHHRADVNAQSSSGNTPLMYACAGGHIEVVRFLLESGSNVEDHNENGHTPLMEAASAGHVGLAKILLMHGAGINTHSNEFKESALTLACYKGHLDMVRFLLEAGADQEHKTDEMHTALMEASMDGHVEVARLLLDSGAQVNMPTDSFESPLTLAACGGHVDLAMLLIERGANIEEVNDEGYTPLMEAAREGHEEMVHLLLNQGANINAQTDETQETALTLACCGGFTEVADCLLKTGAEIELGASTPLMEAAQEGHLELVRFLLEYGANVNAVTQTNDTALTYACENGHTDVAELLIQCGADIEHESEGGRTPLMKACRAGHLCTVKFLIDKGANVRKQTTNNDHTPLSLACAGGHLPVVQLLLENNADPNHKLKDNSTMLIEAAKGGHTNVVQLLLDYPHSLLLGGSQQQQQQQQQQVNPAATTATNLSMLPGQVAVNRGAQGTEPMPTVGSSSPFFSSPNAVLQEVPEAVRIVHKVNLENVPMPIDFSGKQAQQQSPTSQQQSPTFQQQQRNAPQPQRKLGMKLLPFNKSTRDMFDSTLTSAEAQQVRTPPLSDFEEEAWSASAMEFLNREDPNTTLIEIIKKRKQFGDDGNTQKQQILEELHRVERELNGKQQLQQQAATTSNHVFQYQIPQDQSTNVTAQSTVVAPVLNFDLAIQQQKQQGIGYSTGQQLPFYPELGTSTSTQLFTTQSQQAAPTFYFTSMAGTTAPVANGGVGGQSAASGLVPASSLTAQPIKFQSVADVSQNTAINDRPKAKPIKKDGKNARKQQLATAVQNGQQQTVSVNPTPPKPFNILTEPQQIDPNQSSEHLVKVLEDVTFLKDDQQESLTNSLLQQIHHTSSLTTIPIVKTASTAGSPQNPHLEAFDPSQASLNGVGTKLELTEKDFTTPEDVVQMLEVQPYSVPFDETTIIASLTAAQQAELQAVENAELARVEYFALQAGVNPPPPPGPGVNIQSYSDHYYQGFQAGFQLKKQHLDALAAAGGVAQPQTFITTQQPPTQQPPSNQVQAATQTQVQAQDNGKKTQKVQDVKKTKGRVLRHQNTTPNFAGDQNYQIDHNAAITQYNGGNPQQQPTQQQRSCAGGNAIHLPSSMDVDSETESNHDTALTLACAGGHEELVELLISRGADIEHRDKKGFTPLILAATAGHERVVEILLNHNADIEAQSERTKDTPLSLACSGGRYEVVELLLNRNANKEHRNVSDYTPLSLAASGGYVNIIKLLLNNGAEINSRTGSKLGISPLMLAAMNGHGAAVKLLLDMGSDINAQIETNRNTALTLACFQGRHEVVSLLLDRKANVEHRAKTGLTPLMEAASGGYVEVGRVLLDKGADVNATPVPSSRDTALTIAADKGHVKFVELLLDRGAQVEVKNKKGNSPLWLAANGGHLPVIEMLYNHEADIDSQDNRKVSCLMAAFRRGHVRVVKWMVHHVTQFPSDQEMLRYIATISDKELLEKCHECVRIIRAAKETQAAKANKNASILLEELESERTREESKKLQAAKRRERKKKKRLEKKEQHKKLLEENQKNENFDEKKEDEEKDDSDDAAAEVPPPINQDKEEGDSGIDANSQGSCSSNDIKSSKEKRKNKKSKKGQEKTTKIEEPVKGKATTSKECDKPTDTKDKENKEPKTPTKTVRKAQSVVAEKPCKSITFETTIKSADEFECLGSESFATPSKPRKSTEEQQSKSSSISPKQSTKRDEGWKEVVRKSSVQTVSEAGTRKVSVPLNAISRVIGRGGSNINAIRACTGALIEVEKQSKGQGERIITIKGNADATKQSHGLITMLIKDPDLDIQTIIPKTVAAKVPSTPPTTLWDKTQIATKKNAGKLASAVATTSMAPASKTAPVVAVASQATTRFSTTLKYRQSAPVAVATRVTAPRLMAQIEKNSTVSRVPVTSATSTINRMTSKVVVTVANQTFAAKLSETNNCIVSTAKLPRNMAVSPQPTANSIAITNLQNSPSKQNIRPAPAGSAPPVVQQYQSTGSKIPQPPAFKVLASCVPAPVSEVHPVSVTSSIPSNPVQPIAQLQQQHQEDLPLIPSIPVASEYTLFRPRDYWDRREQETQKIPNFAAITTPANVQHKFMDQEPPPTGDITKAPGYRGMAVCSPVSSSKTSSNSATPPNIVSSLGGFQIETHKQSTLPPIGPRSSQPTQNTDFIPFMDYNKGPTNGMPLPNMINEPPLMQNFNPIQGLNFPQQPVMSRLNPKAPEYSGYNSMATKSNVGPQPPLQFNVNGFQPLFGKNLDMSYNHRTGASNSQNRSWLGVAPPQPTQSQPQPTFTQQESMSGLAMSGLAGMTIQNLQEKVYSAEGLEHNSPTMSPSMQQHTLHGGEFGLDDRKPPPIGTERARKAYSTQMEPNNWTVIDKPVKWTGNSLEYGMRPPAIYQEEASIDYPRPIHSGDSYMNGPHYYNHQPPIQNIRPDFIPDLPKIDINWENTCQIPDLQDKQHNWTNKQWNN